MSANPHDLSTDPVITALTPVRATVKAFATGLVIKSEEGYVAAAERLKIIKGALAQIEEARTRITKPINESLRETNAQAKAAAAPFQADELVIKHAMIRYSDEQDRIRREEQRKANAKAEAERKRLQDAADRNAAKGNSAKAESFAERAQNVVAPVSQQAAPKVAGVSIPQVWTFEITNPQLIPREYLVVDEVKIRKQVNAMKGDTCIPGVTVRQVKRIASGSA